REEGVWLLPGLGLLAAAAIFASRQAQGECLRLLRDMGIVAFAFLAVYGAFLAANRIAYGSFAGVDFKERNFVAAVGALQSVEVGPVVPYVPVPLAVRNAVAKVSPTFAPLSVPLAPGGDLFGWSEPGCRMIQSTCGDIAGGWFVFALRDAAAANGFYRSPDVAAESYARLVEEVAAACADGRLQCHHLWVPYMPRFEAAQWRALPRAVVTVAAKVSLFSPPKLSPPHSMLEDARLAEYWSFLNFPRIYRIDQSQSDTVVHGWFYDRQSTEWPELKAYTADGREIPARVTRLPSPDIQRHFSDDRAGTNRYKITFPCPQVCAKSRRIKERSA